MKRLYLAALLLIATVSFQNCGSPNGASGSDNQTLSVTNKALGVYDTSSIAEIRYSISGGFRPVVPSTTAVVSIYLSDSPASVSLTEHSVDTTPAQACSRNANLSSADLNTLLTALAQAHLTVRPNSSAVAVDCGNANLTIRLRDSSEHSYTFENICLSPGTLMIQDSNYALGNLLTHYLNSMLCMSDQ